MVMYQQPSISATVAAAKTKIASDLAYQQKIAEYYREAFRQVTAETISFGDWVAKRQIAGEAISPSWLMRQERYLSLQSQMASAVESFGENVESLLQSQRFWATRAGLDGLLDEVLRTNGLVGKVGNIGDFSRDTWAKFDAKAFEAASALTTLQRSPLTQLLSNMGPDVLAEFRGLFLSGIAIGKNPRVIARSVASRIQGMTQGRAQLIARTEWHRATRIARSEAFQQSDVIRSWIWRAAQDRTTCGVCFLMHGTEHPVTETLAGHPGCRCVMVPRTKDWHELGLPGTPATSPKMEPGSSMFRRLSEAEQRRLIGPTRLEQWKNGVKLKDMLYDRPNAVWGPMRMFKNLPPKGFAPGGPKPTPGGFLGDWMKIDFNSLLNGSDAGRFVQRLTNAIKAEFTQREKLAVHWYQGGSYRDFNLWARGLPPKSGGTRTPSLIAEYEENHKAIAQALSRVRTSEDMLVWRGMRTKSQPIVVGGSFVDNGVVSTSYEKQFAESFSGSYGTQGNTSAILHIHVPKGSRAVTADDVSDRYMGEMEILLPPGTRFHVLRQIGNSNQGTPQYEVVAVTP